MEETRFKDRVAEYPGRKKLTIISQTGNEMYVDVELADGATTEGTKVNAELLNEFDSLINAANATSSNAQGIASDALTTANSAVSTATEANTAAAQANTIAEEAKIIAQEAKGASAATQTALETLSNQVVTQQGTKVTIGGPNNFVSTFEATTKVDQTVYDAAVGNLTTRLSTVEVNPVLTSVVYDAATDTFTF